MNNQEFFNTVVTKLIEQGRPSINTYGSGCAYRGAEGTKCAIGILIPDEEYFFNPTEGTSVSSILCDRSWPTLNTLAETVDEKLMSAMQCAHDGIGIFKVANSPVWHNFGRYEKSSIQDDNWLSNFKERAKIVAEAWGLEYAHIS